MRKRKRTVCRTLNFRTIPNATFLGYMNRIVEKFGTNYQVLYMKTTGSFVNAEILVSK